MRGGFRFPQVTGKRSQMLGFETHTSEGLELHRVVFSSKEFALFTQALKNDVVEAVFNTK